MAPTLLKRIVDLPAAVRARYDVSSMRAIVMAAAPCPMRVKEEVIAHFGPVPLRVLRLDRARPSTPCCGRRTCCASPARAAAPRPGVELALLDDDGQPVPPGSPASSTSGATPASSTSTTRTPRRPEQTRRGDWLTVGDVA